MITYEYKCDTCGICFEIKQSIKDKPLINCDACGNKTLHRVIYTTEFFDKTPRTVGTLAEQRTRKHRGHVNEMDAKKKEEIAKKRKEPWYGTLPKDKRKILDDPQKVNDYIIKGK